MTRRQLSAISYQLGRAWRPASISVSLLYFFLLMGCRVAPPVVKIGLVSPFEGANRAVGYDAIYSARLAVREINAQGGIGGYKVALVALDDGGRVGLAQETAEALVLDTAVVGVIGHGLPATNAAVAEIYAAAGVPFVRLGEGEYGRGQVAELSPEFVAAYEAITPFDETPDVYAEATYAGMQYLLEKLKMSYDDTGEISREWITTHE